MDSFHPYAILARAMAAEAPRRAIFPH